MINKNQIYSKLSKLDIEMLSSETKFNIHADAEITATSFVTSFFIMISKSENTLREWAIELSLVLGRVFSKSAINCKLQYRHLSFAKELLKEVLAQQLENAQINGLSSNLLSTFRKVYIEDSVCMKVPSNLASIFPGAKSKNGNVGTARIQCRMELKSGVTTRLEIQSFRDNDQKFAPDILHSLKPNDLVIRDMGYWTLWVFRLINKMDAYFLSRFRYNTNLYNVKNGDKIDLLRLLKKAKKKGQKTLSLNVLLGKDAQIPVRLVVIEAPQNILQQRCRKAKKDRSIRTNHSKEYMEMLGWTIFITNVEEEKWTPKEILKVYGYRWRIEIVFKCWKSHFKMENFFSKKQTLSPPRAMVTFYFILTWITLFFVQAYNLFLSTVYKTKKTFVSILKFAKFYKKHFTDLVTNIDLEFYIDLVAKHCTYDKRKTQNFCQNLYVLNFTKR